MAHHPIIEAFQRAGQAQVFAFFDRLAPDAQQRLLAEAAEVDLAEVERLYRSLVAKSDGAAGVNLAGLAPAPYEKRPEHGGDAADWARAKAAGEAALRAGRVAAFTVAGGQGTRLGYDGPKGTFPVTPLRQKPLFQVFAEKIRAAGVRYGRPLPWFIMTSHANHAATETFFAANAHFGLDRARVHFFRQGRMPAVDFNGQIMLETPGSLALSPDGHGGSLRALDRSGALDLMKREGIDTLSYFQVDNPLVRCIDPAFIGWHVLRGSEMTSKMVPKAYAEEKVGHFCMQDGKSVVVEYSDLPMAMQRETDAGGGLRYIAGSIAIHVLDREFVRRGGGAAVPPGRQENSDRGCGGWSCEAGEGQRREIRDVRVRCAPVCAESRDHRDAPVGRFLAGEKCRGPRFAADVPRRPAPAVRPLAHRQRRGGGDRSVRTARGDRRGVAALRLRRRFVRRRLEEPARQTRRHRRTLSRLNAPRPFHDHT